MNRTSISTNSFSIPAVIAAALTASTISNVENINSPIPLTFPYYLAQSSAIDPTVGELPVITTSTNQSDLNIASDKDQYETLVSFGETMVSRSKDVEPEIAKIIDDNFWDLI